MVQTKQITFAYNPRTNFHFPDINCQAGQSILITGASGKGKTTLLHLLGGLLKPTSGEVIVNEVAMNTLSQKQTDKFRGQHIGIVFQHAHFVASLSVLENVMLAQTLSGRKKDRSRAMQLLTNLGIDAHHHKTTNQLSMGQQQRVSIARALVNNPALLLADEPTSSLDDDNCNIVADLLQQQAKEAGAALIVVSHDFRLKSIFQQAIHLT